MTASHTFEEGSEEEGRRREIGGGEVLSLDTDRRIEKRVGAL